MKRSHRAVVSLVVLAVALGIASLDRIPGAGRETARDATATRDGEFDYFLVALSWSPTYCEANPHDKEQCGRRGYGFVLHGLWPQYEHGSGPQDCATTQGPDRATLARTLAFMPSRRLIEHEWRAHGACSGMDPAPYFALADRAFAAVRIPDALVAGARPATMTAREVGAAFVRANPGLRDDMFGVICRGRDLAEVRICVDTELDFRTCGRGVRTRCPRDAPLRIPAAR